VTQSDDSSDSGPSTFEEAVAELVRVVEPVAEAVEGGPTAIIAFLDDTGVGELLVEQELEKVISTFEQDIVEPVTELKGILGGDFQPEPEDIKTILATVSGFDPENPDPEALLEAVREIVEPVDSIIQGVQTLSKLEFQDENLDDAGERLLNYLLVRYLREHRTHAHRVLRMTNVIELPEDGTWEEYGTLKLGNVERFFTDPTGAVKEGSRWGRPDFPAGLAVEYLAKLFGLLGIFTRLEPPMTAEQAELLQAAGGDDFEADLEQQLAVPVVQIPGLGTLGVRIVPIPDLKQYNPGVAVVLYGPFNSFDAEFSEDLADNWTFSGGFSAELEKYGMVVQPEGPDANTNVEFRPLDDNAGLSALDTVDASTSLTYDGTTASGEYRPLIGTADGTRIALGTVAAEANVDYEDGEVTITVELPADGKVVINPKGGFLEKVLPDEIESNFELATGWSTEDGLYFEGGGTLTVPLPVHQELGPITLKEIYLGVSPDPKSGKITAEGSAAANVNLGPITATVERMGIEAEVSFPENRDGNLGPIELELGFSPPKGVGLSLEAGGAVTGSGYLFFDHENERYAGAAQLKASKVTASAVGLITTELPDGSDGFSMQVIVAGQFPPIQIGPGFTLMGVGGLAGIHRKFRKGPLRKVVRKGNLDSVLFPKRETVKNSPQRLLSDIRSIFPPRRDSYVFGPMLQLGFGTPTVMKASLGVVLEIPSLRVAILGRFELVLPSHEAKKPSGMSEQAPFPPVVLNLDVIGIIDIPGKSISIDGTLYDSRLLNWTVEGDLALRSSWGETSRFILSIGGFNSRYTPPKDAPGLRKLDRVKVSLDVPGGQPVVNFEGYFAVTSNTFQVGAKVYAELALGNFKIWGKLGFDALIQFKPFKFIFDFLAAFQIEAPAFKMGFKLDGTIKGPNPLNINGKVKLQAGPVKVNTKFDLTLGPEKQAEPLPPAEVLPELREALTKSGNWKAQLPDDGNSMASLRGPDPDSQKETDSEDEPPVRAHPRGSMTVSQSVVPLEYGIEKFGENSPKSFDEFEIDRVSVAGETDNAPTDVDGEFAPAKYEKMSNAEKLEKPDFVDRTAGVTVGEAEPLIGDTDENTARASFVYEERVEDDGLDVDEEPVETLQSGSIDFGPRTHSEHSATTLMEGRSSASGTDGGRFDVSQEHPPADESGGAFTVDPVEYVVVDETEYEVVMDETESGSAEGEDVAEGVSLAEAKRRIEAVNRRGEYDADSLTVMRKDRVSEESLRLEGVDR